MFATLTSRAGLTVSTAIVAVGLVVAVPYLNTGPDAVLTGLPMPEAERGAPAAKTAAKTAVKPAANTDMVATGRPAPVPEPRSYQLSKPKAVMPATERAPMKNAAQDRRGRPGAAMVDMAAPVGGMNGVNAPQAMMREMPPAPIIIQPDTEAYPKAETNPLKITSEDPVSTFSIDVDTASWGIVRSSISRGALPPKGAVRIEEMVNYFPYDYPAPEAGGHPFRPTVTVTGTPWNPDTQLVHIAVQGQKPVMENRPPLNLVFLIDTSGSMQSRDKLPLLKQSLGLMLPQLTEADQVAIVAYAGSAGQVLAPTPATDRATIMGALDRLSAGGGTAGQAGLQQAYAVAKSMAKEGEVTRVLLATDGDFNVGLSDPEALKTYIANERKSGTYLSVLGFGRGNLDDATMQALAQNGNGTAAYIDTLHEARKVLVDQMSGALFPIADDVKIQVEFNPAQVAEYRLIGYETRALKREDFNNDKVDAGDIGAGARVTAIYEVTPVGSKARLSDPLRYGAAKPAPTGDELGYLKLRYKAPGASQSQLIETPIRKGTAEPGDDIRFATAIAGFGQLLSDPKYLKDWSFADAITLANGARGADSFGYRAEAVRLMRLAQSLSKR